MARYEVVLPEEKEQKKRKFLLFFLFSTLMHVGMLYLIGGRLSAFLQEAKLREIQMVEEQLKKKKKLNPKQKKMLEKKKDKKKDKPKMDLKPKLSKTLPNPNIKIGGPKLKVKMPEEMKLKIAQSQILPEQMHVKDINLKDIAELEDMQAKIDIEALDTDLDASMVDAVVAVSAGVSTSDILAMEAIPAVSIGGGGIEGAEGGGLGLGGDGGGGGISLGGGGSNDLTSTAPPTEIKVKPAGGGGAADVDLGASGPSKSPMQLTGQVANRKILKKVSPVYPSKAKREGWEGVVVLKFWVSAGGAVKNIQIVRSTGYPELDNSARSALASWKFGSKPGSADEWGQLTVRFSLM